MEVGIEMPGRRKNSRKAKRIQRRARHNQNKKEGAVMTENITITKDETTKITAEATESTIPADEACAITEKVTNETTDGAAADASLSGKEETTVDNKPENVNVKKEPDHKLYIQYNDLEFSDELMFEAAVIAYCNEYNQDKSSVESVNLYVKPQEGKAYYVINNDAEKTGSIDL